LSGVSYCVGASKLSSKLNLTEVDHPPTIGAAGAIL